MTEDFADIVYSFLLERLDIDEKGSTLAARNALDSELGISTWRTPFSRKMSGEHRQRQQQDLIDPSWWHGDEEASQAFLRSMGVRLHNA